MVIMPAILVTKRNVLVWLILEMSVCYGSDSCLKLNIDHTIGMKLPVSPLKSLDGIGPSACFKECQRLRNCLSVNYNRKHFICDLIGRKKSNVEPLINDGDVIHMDLPDINDPMDKICGNVNCNNYSTCIHTLFNESVCIATECAEPLPTLKNGVIIRQTYSPISATFACSPGYTPVGTINTIHCRPGGKWSSLSYSCHAPVDGGWGSWSGWGSCSKSCDGGTKVRNRSCNNPIPRYAGSYCNGPSEDSVLCNTNNCPIDGGWGNWGSWSSCTKTCGTGSQNRDRKCDNPPPIYGGATCSGASRHSRECNKDNCPGWLFGRKKK